MEGDRAGELPDPVLPVLPLLPVMDPCSRGSRLHRRFSELVRASLCLGVGVSSIRVWGCNVALMCDVHVWSVRAKHECDVGGSVGKCNSGFERAGWRASESRKGEGTV